MGCNTCGTNGCSPAGCGDNGHCSTGGCNRKNTYDWMSHLDIGSADNSHLMEISFKNGAHKDFYANDTSQHFDQGDLVAVESRNGYDVGSVSLSGELVKLQMKKKRFKDGTVLPKVLRRAHNKDLQRLKEARDREKETIIRGRAMIKSLNLNMKLSDVIYQGDMRKCTFYYTADGRIDFRELVRILAKEFKVKVEMRQIGARQESALLGGIGSCGRELCCSTWLSDFKSVNTAAARYQNLAINQAKLSGQCGRLKCCLNYELDTYMDALKEFPRKADSLHTEEGKCVLIKTDIFKRVMYYSIPSARGRNSITAVPLDRVKEVLELNKNGEKPDKLVDTEALLAELAAQEVKFADVTGQIDLPAEKRKKRGRGNRNRNRNRGRNKKSGGSGNPRNQDNKQSGQQRKKKDGSPEGGADKPQGQKPKSNKSRRNKRSRGPRRDNKQGPAQNSGRGPKSDKRSGAKPSANKSGSNRPPQNKDPKNTDS